LKKEKIEQFIFLAPVMTLISCFILLRGLFFLLINNRYRGFADFCWLVRVSKIKPFNAIGKWLVKRHIDTIFRNSKNHISESFRKSSYASKYIAKYSISEVGKQDIFRDIIVLKSPSTNEKGVIMLKYAQTFEAFLYFFDVNELLNKYYFVLEPCWAGYCNTNILIWLFPNHQNSIIVQCYTKEDYDFISTLKPFLLPVKLGPADWVNTDNFKPLQIKNKFYDIVMVANWALIKRHIILFKALQKIKRKINVLLVGYAWGGRTSQDILNEAKIINNSLINIKILENLSHAEVVKQLSNSKIFIFLTRKEGDNKALVEAIFTDLPVIVYKDTIGGASSRINESTGILSSYANLDKSILYMLDNYKKFSPRKWAINNTGSINATKKLNSMIKHYALLEGEDFTEDIVEKINSPNLDYKNPLDRQKFQIDYDYINNCKRKKISSFT